MANEYKGMTERDLLVVMYETLKELKNDHAATVMRLAQLERDFLLYKTETTTRMKTYIAIASSVATALGSIASFLIQHFLK